MIVNITEIPGQKMQSLNRKQIAIDAASVTKGMYVSKLDRPWLETPFIFQGFEIREHAEIDLLQKHCEIVYIDVDRGDLSDMQVQHLIQTQGVSTTPAPTIERVESKEPGRFQRWLQGLLMRLGLYRQAVSVAVDEQVTYPIQSTVRGEASEARDAYLQLAEHHRNMIEIATVKSEVDFDALRDAVQPAIESVLRNPNAMAWTVFSRKRSDEKYNRSVGTAIWCLLFGRQLGLERDVLDDLALGGLLLDVGNARIPRSIAGTEGKISPNQYEELQQHVQLGLEILDCSRGVPKNVVDMVRCHHERADGSGYPEGLRGNQIPGLGRIAAIADCYDAMTTVSPYSQPMAAYDAARALNDMRGKEFAAEVVGQFLATMGMFPVASIVELNNGCIAVVLEQNPNNVLKPKVMLLLDSKHEPLPERQVVEMRDLPADVTHSNALWIVQGHEHGAFGIEPADIFKG
jgi:HD-GYP domain-containing protein (c-di-GMP phosphodiesterase class II)